MRAGRQSTRRAKAVSTRTDDDVGAATDDVGQGFEPVRIASARIERQPDDRADRARGVPLAALDDLRTRPARTSRACRERRSPPGRVRRRCRPGTPRASSRRARGRYAIARVEQRRGDALAARPPRHDEADDRPDRRVVDRREDLGVREPLVVLARPEADPADGSAVLIGDQPGRQRPVPSASRARPGSRPPSNSTSRGRGTGSRRTSTTSDRRPPRTGPPGQRSAPA